MANDPILHLLGLARRAGRLEIGEEPVGAACRARQARLLLLAQDAAPNTRRRAAHFGEAGNVLWLEVPFDKSQLGMALGRNSCAMLALTDAGFSSAVAQKLAQRDGERYGPAARQLKERADRVLQRQREQRRHEKNLREGKRRAPWAAPPESRQESPPEGQRTPKRAPSQKRPGPGGRRLTGKFRKP